MSVAVFFLICVAVFVLWMVYRRFFAKVALWFSYSMIDSPISFIFNWLPFSSSLMSEHVIFSSFFHVGVCIFLFLRVNMTLFSYFWRSFYHSYISFMPFYFSLLQLLLVDAAEVETPYRRLPVLLYNALATHAGLFHTTLTPGIIPFSLPRMYSLSIVTHIR